MLLFGLQKLTLIDYPGKLACTVFTGGCNFRCPFCHNPELVNISSQAPKISEEVFFDFLKKRAGKLEGVCVTGGEPIIQPGLLDFLKKIKALKFFVKLDTNGTGPGILKTAISENLLDYVAMDIKAPVLKYEEASGVKIDIEKIQESAAIIMNSPVNYEFRTTVVPGIHDGDDIIKIAKWLKGAKAYYLQTYRDINILDEKLRAKTKGKTIDLEKILSKAREYIANVQLRNAQ